MKTRYILILLLAFFSIAATHHDGGLYSTNTANIHFFSHTDVEDIEADNHKAKAAFDAKSGKIQFSLLIKDFKFEKALMQEHFNENYMESTKYPRATFSGQIEDIEDIELNTDGTYSSTISGKLTIKDVTKEISTSGTFKVQGEEVNGKASFIVNPEDYNINIPRIVSKKISREIKVSIDANFAHNH